MTTPALDRAAEFAAIIERVHGQNHPELTRVREITAELTPKPCQSDVAALFSELREVTDNYAIPADVCETFEATYQALQEAKSELGQ